MHKIKKGIKKKIKGKKEKDDELFTPEELEKYKKRKEEEARRLAEQEQQQNTEAPEQQQQDQQEQHPESSEPTEEGATADTSQTKASSSGDNDWKSFFAATDTVLKQTSDNLVHIKEVSFFQQKDDRPTEVTNSTAPVPSAAGPAPVASSGKKWVDLEKEGLDDDDYDEEVEGAQQQETSQKEPETEPEPEPKLELHYIEDLPEVDYDDFTEVFDTTYVDNVESGQVKLHYIPDSPTTEDPNEPDPFDTSVVDKVLHIDEPKPKAKEEPKPIKKKKKLVSLGCAVEVLSGNVQNVEKSPVVSASSKRRRVIPKEVNLLADFQDNEESSVEIGETSEKEEEEESAKAEEKNILDDILCVGELDSELPEPGVFLSPTPRATTPVVTSEETEKQKDDNSVVVSNGLETENKEVDLSEFLESSPDQDSKESKPDNGKDLDLKDLVAEFDIIDKSEVTNETLVVAESDPIDDEFDAEFAFLAAESVAKAKEKEAEELEDDPFDTSAAAQVLRPEDNTETEKDPFDVGFAEEALGEEAQAKAKTDRPPPPRPAPPKTEEVDPFDTSVADKFLPADTTAEVDPFDTSAAEKLLPVDPFALTEPEVSLPETLQPQQGNQLVKSDSFDPFDTSIAESFGKTELKVLETELLTAAEAETKGTLSKSNSDFDFNPRAEEPEPEAASNTCLLTSTDNENTTSDPVLAPSQDTQSDDFDPFDTSIAAKVEIQSLEAELLSQPDQIQQIGKQQPPDSKKAPPPRPSPAQTPLLAATPTDTNPTLQPSVTSDLNPGEDKSFDPFDTSIADNFGKTELKSLENELLTSQKELPNVTTTASDKPKSLHLPVKPLHPPSPKCLLATTPLDDQPTLQPVLEPSAEPSDKPTDDFDPFDTSIADQFGQTELKVLESELLTTSSTQNLEEDINFNPREGTEAPPPRPLRPSRPSSPAPPQCLLTASPARTPTDGELLAPTETKVLHSEEEFDPFDTSIADKFGKTELRQLESELLVSEGSSIANELDDFNPRQVAEHLSVSAQPSKPVRPPRSATCLLATTPTDSSAPLQPSLNQIQGPLEATTAEDFDPFDTSIADKLGKTEIKVLEETLLTEGSKTVPSDNLQVNSVPATSDGTTITPDSFFSSSPAPELGPTLQPVLEQKQVEAEELDPFDTSIADRFGKTELKTLETELLADSGTKRNLSDDEFDPREEENKVPKRPPIPKSATPVNLLDSGDDHNITDQPLQALQAQSTANTLNNYDPFDTSIAADIVPSKFELKQIESELLAAKQDPIDTSKIA